MPTRTAINKQRIFFALTPPAALAQAILACAKRSGIDPAARSVVLESLHLTLVFLGERNDEEVEGAIGVANAITQAPFEIRLERCEFRSRQAIVWLRALQNARLSALVEALRDGLVKARIPFDAKPFLPHVTLARKARTAIDSMCDVIWPVGDFVLMRSRQSLQGSYYQVIGRWLLK